MKKPIYLISLFVMMMVFTIVFVVSHVKVSGSKYEEILKREASGLPDSRNINLVIRVKPDRTREELTDTLQYAYANELMAQVRKKQTLNKIAVYAYTSATDFQNNPDTSWKARLEKSGEGEEKIFFLDKGNTDDQDN